MKLFFSYFTLQAYFYIKEFYGLYSLCCITINRYSDVL